MINGRLRLLIFASGIASALSGHAAWGQGCTCDGVRLDSFSGGDGNPLDWRFATYVVQAGSPHQPTWICYLKGVSNKSTMQVRNVSWEIARYFRSKVWAGKASHDCPTIPGEMSSGPATGPLHYSVASASQYDTTVRLPKRGWDQAQLSPSGEAWPIVRSAFDVTINAAQSALIVVYSAVAVVGKESVLTYDVANNGNGIVWLTANLPATETLMKDVPLVKGIELKPGSRSVFRSVSTNGFDARAVTVTVLDSQRKNLLAADVAGFYVPAKAKPLRSDDEIWKFLQPR
jgi:hypothetical protein